MAQERFWEYRDDDSTIRLDNWLMGCLLPGRYVGFDFSSVSGLNLTIGHSKTGVVYNDVSNSPKNKQGVWISKTGVVVKEDGEITLLIQPNNSIVDRVDLIYGEHEYRDGVVGGSQATYGVLEGVTDLSLDSNPKRVPLAAVVVPAGAQDLSDINYISHKSPLPTEKNWSWQKEHVVSVSLNNSQRTTKIKPQDLGKNYSISNPTPISETHEVIFELSPHNEDDIGNIYNVVIDTNDLVKGTLIRISYKSSSSDINQIIDFDSYDLNSSERVMLTLKRGVDSLYLSSISRGSDFSTGKNNRSDLAPIKAPVNNIESISETSTVVLIDELKYPSYVKVNSESIDYILNPNVDKPELGTEVILEANHENGLRVLFLDSSASSLPTGQFGIESGSIGASNVSVFDGSFNERDVGLKVKFGGVIKLIFTSNDKWHVVNESMASRVAGLEHNLSENIGNTNATRLLVANQSIGARSSLLENDFANFTHNGTTYIAEGVQQDTGNVGQTGVINLPNDNIKRLIKVDCSSSWEKVDPNSNATVEAAHILNFFKNSDTGLETRIELKRAETNFDQKDSLGFSYMFTHEGDGGFLLSTFLGSGTTSRLSNIVTNYQGTPHELYLITP